MNNTELNFILSVFILSLKKADGNDYTADSLFSLTCALQRHLELNGRPVSLLDGPEFQKLRNTLDNAMQDRTRAGIGINKRQAGVITIEQEAELWERGILGSDNPEKLLRTVFWIIGLHFGLRGGDEHRNLTRMNFKIEQDSDKRKYLLYTETVSKTYRGGIKHRRVDPHTAKAYENFDNEQRCPVKIFEKYISKLPTTLSNVSAFYFKPLIRPKPDIWFASTPVGHNFLRDMVKNIMSLAGFEGHYTNHSLRATTATRLFHDDVPEQLIRAQTGHRSNAIFAYKRPSNEQIRNVSTVLQGKETSNVCTVTSECAVATVNTSEVQSSPSAPKCSLVQFMGPSNVTLNIVQK